MLCTQSLANDTVTLDIRGGDKALRTNIRRHTDIDTLPCDISEIFLDNALDNANKDIIRATQALGYYHAEWHFDYRQNAEKTCRQVNLVVEPNTPVIVSSVSITISGEGENDRELKTVLASLPLKEGARLNHGDYEESKKAIQQKAAALGYFSGRYTANTLRIDTTTNTAEAILHYDSGPRYRFGDVLFPEDLPLELEFLESYKPFSSGDPYSFEKLIAFQSNLNGTQYFSRVSVNQQEPDDSSHTVDIVVELGFKSRYKSTFGAGFSTDIGPRVSYELQNRRFGDDGDTYRLSSQWSPVQKNLGIQLQQPGDDPIREKTLWSLGWQSEDTDSSNSTSYLAEYSRVSQLDNGWVLTRSLSLLQEKFEISDDTGKSTLLYPGISMAKSRGNNPRYPTKGWRLAGSLKGGADTLLSDTDFTQATLDAKLILPLFGGRIIGRSTLGGTWVDDFSALPASLRFFAGGDNSVRGYDYESLGPKDDNGEVIGGKNLITGSIEYDHLVYKDYGAALFYDTGTAFDTNHFTRYESVGFGVRWLSPIGAIRVDFAFPLDNGGFRLHLSMGPDL